MSRVPFLLTGLVATPKESRASFASPGFPDWALDQSPRFAAANGMNDWYEDMSLFPAQIYPNCFIVFWCLMFMSLIRREHGAGAIPRGHWINPNRIYERFDKARRGNLSDGGQMHDGINWGIAHEGWFKDVRIGVAHFPFRPDYLERMLAVCPVGIGMATHDGWMNPSRENGYIRPALPNPQAGHAVQFVDHRVQDGAGFCVFPLQWGQDIGANGYATMNDEHVAQSVISDCLALHLPDGTGKAWADLLEPIS